MDTEGGEVRKNGKTWKGGGGNVLAFYFLFVNIFRSKKNLVDISIIFSFFIFGLFFFLLEEA